MNILSIGSTVLAAAALDFLGACLNIYGMFQMILFKVTVTLGFISICAREWYWLCFSNGGIFIGGPAVYALVLLTSCILSVSNNICFYFRAQQDGMIKPQDFLNFNPVLSAP